MTDKNYIMCCLIFERILSIFDHATLKKIISLLLFTVSYQAIPHWKGQKLNFQETKFQSQETHYIRKKINKAYF